MWKLPRKRRIFKWAGLLTCVLLAIAIVLSKWGMLYWSSGNYWGYVQLGAIGFGRSHPIFDRGNTIQPLAFGWHAFDVDYPMWWSFGYRDGSQTAFLGRSVFIMPLWAPLVLIGVPTILAWRRERPPPPGHCRHCSYNLTGSVSGVCPECGTEIEQP